MTALLCGSWLMLVHGEAREWRLRNDARLALLAAVAASPTTERTPS